MRGKKVPIFPFLTRIFFTLSVSSSEKDTGPIVIVLTIHCLMFPVPLYTSYNILGKLECIIIMD